MGIYRRRRAAAALVAVVVLAALGTGAWTVFYRSGLLLVDRVTVDGTVALPPSAVLTAADVPTGGPLASVDVHGVAERVAALPAVASAHVDRSWPHTVAITVVERTAVASITTPSGVQLVDAGGAVFPGTPAPGLPRLALWSAGPGDPATTAALTALGALPAPVRSQVETVGATLSGPGATGQVTFGLSGDRRVDWGGPDRAAEKAAVLVPLLTQPGHVFDVSSPDLPTVRR